MMHWLLVPRRFLGAVLALSACLFLASCGDNGGTTTPPTPTISLALSSSTLDLTHGQDNTVTVNVTRGGGYTGAVDLSLEGALAGVSGTFSPASLPAGASSSTLTLSATAGAAEGAHQLTVRAQGEGEAEQTASLAVTVAEAPGISLSVEPDTLSLEEAERGDVVITITRTNFTGAVSLSLEGTPAGVIGTFDPASLTGEATTSTLTLAAAADATIGAGELVIRAQGEAIEATTVTVMLTVESSGAWSALGEGLDNTVHSLAAMGCNLYAGGRFRRSGVDDSVVVNHVARWDGSSWSALSGEFWSQLSMGSVDALAGQGRDLFIGGHFSEHIGETPVRFIVRWSKRGRKP